MAAHNDTGSSSSSSYQTHQLLIASIRACDVLVLAVTNVLLPVPVFASLFRVQFLLQLSARAASVSFQTRARVLTCCARRVLCRLRLGR